MGGSPRNKPGISLEVNLGHIQNPVVNNSVGAGVRGPNLNLTSTTNWADTRRSGCMGQTKHEGCNGNISNELKTKQKRIALEVDLVHTQCDGPRFGLMGSHCNSDNEVSQAQDVGSSSLYVEVSVDSDKQGRARRGRDEKKGGAVGMGSWSRGAVLRGKAGLKARSDAQRKVTSKEKSGARSKLELIGRNLQRDLTPHEEAEATIRMGKALGICVGGKEEEVKEKLKAMEIKDKVQAASRAVHAQLGVDVQN
ncbi:hypothetical protein LOK49_LG04G03061 [Camellia lanceoleosa]|uniref:Uncharacterized protein n=1 Tax=Camellia lanceoleosa TaxID=1840588 RepID=A0ACC0HX63_9ERIC|nr:hypothetical protein LOK49_LG04G03061 [Camellia lanceoleosa]